MTRNLLVTLVCLLFAGAANADPISVRVQTTDKAIHIGSILGTSASGVQFQGKTDVQPRQIPSAQIRYIKFPVTDRNEDTIIRLHEEKNYPELYALLNQVLPPFRAYVAYPSNLTQKFLRWMESAYWVGDHELVVAMAKELKRFKTAEYVNQILFYTALVQLESGDVRVGEALLARSDVDKIFPPGSAARLYVEASVLAGQEKYIPAIRTAAELMALHSRDADWMPRAELLCAQMYLKLNMPDSAQSALADINEFYTDPDILKKAAAIAAE